MLFSCLCRHSMLHPLQLRCEQPLPLADCRLAGAPSRLSQPAQPLPSRHPGHPGHPAYHCCAAASSAVGKGLSALVLPEHRPPPTKTVTTAVGGRLSGGALSHPSQSQSLSSWDVVGCSWPSTPTPCRRRRLSLEPNYGSKSAALQPLQLLGRNHFRLQPKRSWRACGQLCIQQIDRQTERQTARQPARR